MCFFFLLNIYVSWYIYCYTDTTKRMYCSYNSAFDLVIDTVATVTEVFFFSFSNRFVFFFSFKNLYKLVYILLYYRNKFHNIFTIIDRHCSYSAFFFFSNWFVFFFSFKYLCKLVYILLYRHNKFHNIFTIIDVSISYKSK